MLVKIPYLILGIIGNFVFFISLVQAGFSFTIPQTSINEDQEIEATINLALQGQGNKNYYLEGAFKREGAVYYFGATWNDADWVNYTSSNSDKSLKSITTNPEGSWSGVLKTKLDVSSNQFTGSGNYILKINRFTATGSVPTSSDNEITLAVTAFPTPTNEPTPIDTSTPSPTETSSPTPTPTKKPTITPTKPPTSKPTLTPTSANTKVDLPASILGTAITPSPTPSPTSTKLQTSLFSFNNLLIASGGIILILVGVFVFTFLAKDKFKKI